ncbi:MAG: esterase [Bacteroidia bacterium]|nr:esterase [Bacteroidia bacterium]
MENIRVLVLLLFSMQLSFAQAIYQDIQSDRLDETRELKIQLPRNYDPEAKREYPLILVFDGDYLFEPVAGNIDYQSYWEDIPDCIVVGVKQGAKRENDFRYDEDSYFPAQDSAAFYEFIAAELLPFMENNYNISSFKIIVGHDLSANFLNYYLFKDSPLFRAYIVLSPDFAPEMINRLSQRLSIVTKEIFYYLATGDADISALRTDVLEANTALGAISNSKFHYKFDDFDDANHYSLVGRGIPRALNQIFSLFKPISAKEYNEKLITFELGPFEYLVKKYEDIEYFYGFEKKLIENDIRAVAAAAELKDDLDALENLSKLVKKEFSDSMLSAYYLGLYQEKAGNLKRALQRYQSGLLLEPSQFIDKDILLEKMYTLKEELKK